MQALLDSGVTYFFVFPTIYDSAGSLLAGTPAITLYILEALVSSFVLDMPFLSAYNPIIDWARYTVNFGSLIELCSPQQPAAAVEFF